MTPDALDRLRKPEYIEAGARNPYMGPMVIMEPSKYRSLLDALDAREADSARLDYIERENATVYASVDPYDDPAKAVAGHWVFVGERGGQDKRKGILGYTLRAAIDAALRGGK